VSAVGAITQASSHRSSPEPALVEELPRAAYLRYAGASLAAVLARCTIQDARGDVRPARFQLRVLGPGALGYREPLALPEASACGVVAAHVDALTAVTIPEVGAKAMLEGAWRADLPGAPETGRWDARVRGEGDFDFAYPLPDPPAVGSVGEYLLRSLDVLLDAVDLIDEQGAAVRWDAIVVDGERLQRPALDPARPLDLAYRDERTGHAGHRQPLYSVVATEPPIVCLARHWSLVSGVIVVEQQPSGKHVSLDGMRLRRLRDWVVPSRCHPSEIYEHLARVCNVACDFCYLFGNPDSLAVARARKTIKRDELASRLRHYSPGSGRALFHAQWELNEFLVDPKLPGLLGELRALSDQPFFFTTNGNPLTPRLIEQLAAVKPVHLIVSTNTVDEPLRIAVMKESGRRARTALDSLRLLREHEISFGVSVVASPDFTYEQLEDTIHQVGATDAAFVRVNLPGFTRDHPYRMDIDTERSWRTTVEWTRGMRERTHVPLLVVPSAFEENFFHEDPNAARVFGIVTGSPAAAAGMQPGDVIERVGSISIATRGQVGWALLLARGRIEVDVRRPSGRRTLSVDADDPGTFPYSGPLIGKYLFPLGVMAAPSLSPRDADQLRAVLERDGVDRVWIVTSPLMLPAAESFVRQHCAADADRVEYLVATNRFLGGNIRVMDMCTVGDIAAAVRERIEEAGKPDAILLPMSGFNQHGRDIAGRHWGDLEPHVGVPVHPMSVTTAFVF
jgi:uncharacterized Fe-S cluster-containing radical SAM superfamily protein